MNIPKELTSLTVGIFLFFIFLLEIYAVFYAIEVKKAERQLNMAIPPFIKILITSTITYPIIFFFIVAFLLFAVFFRG